jgi:hypothetical protein
MDPHANLAEQLCLANELAEAEVPLDVEMSHKANRLAELVLALNEWMSKGGFLPGPWQVARMDP